MATFRKRNDKWQAQIPRTGCATITKTFTFKSDADAWVRQINADLDRQSIPADKQQLAKVTLTELLKRYMAEITPRKREAVNECCKLKKLIRSEISNLKLIQNNSTNYWKLQEDQKTYRNKIAYCNTTSCP